MLTTDESYHKDCMKAYFLKRKSEIEEQVKHYVLNTDILGLQDLLNNDTTIHILTAGFVTQLLKEQASSNYKITSLLTAYRIKRQAFILERRREQRISAISHTIWSLGSSGEVVDVTFTELFDTYTSLFLDTDTGELYDWSPRWGKRLSNIAYFTNEVKNIYYFIYSQCLNPEGLPELNLVRKPHKEHKPHKEYEPHKEHTPHVNKRIRELTPQILRLNREGYSVTSIARMLGTTRPTVYRVINPTPTTESNE